MIYEYFEVLIIQIWPTMDMTAHVMLKIFYILQCLDFKPVTLLHGVVNDGHFL